MIGPLEIAIIAVVLFVIFGWRYLPGLGRKAGEGARDLKEGVQELVGDKADPKTLGKTRRQGPARGAGVPRRAHREDARRAARSGTAATQPPAAPEAEPEPAGR